MKCFYHDDLDGKVSALCVYNWVGIKDDSDGEFIKINYGTEFPFETIIPDEQVWIVDYSISPEEMLKLLSITKDVVWIDHHKTAIDKYKDFPYLIKGIRKDGEAGCVLTYKYIHWWTNRGEGVEDFNKVGNEIPLFIRLVGDRDVWTWKYGDLTRHFFSGSQLHNTEYASDFWWGLYDETSDDFKQVIKEGEIVERYKKATDDEINKSLGYDVEFMGYKCFAVNRGKIGSDRLGERIVLYDILLPYYHDGKQFTVSLYSQTVDVSEIAKKFGGGGHRGASGFQCVELPFKKV